MAKRNPTTGVAVQAQAEYAALLTEFASLLEQARRVTARAVNGILTVTYWEIGRRIVEFEQRGADRADYGEHLIERLARDLRAKGGRGFSTRNVWNMKAFYLGWEIVQTASAQCQARAIATRSTRTTESIVLRPCIGSDLAAWTTAFPLPWSHYVAIELRAKQARRTEESEDTTRENEARR